MSRGAPSYAPCLSTYDPPEPHEGGLDPLGLAQFGGRLADELCPGMTERVTRPRFLTALAFGARLLGRQDEGTYGVHREGPANIAFERLLLEAFAHRGKGGRPGTARDSRNR